jgi:hypothetical protein
VACSSVGRRLIRRIGMHARSRLVLVTDGDDKVWTVANPEALAEHQGHHVQVKATADGDKSTINVQEVKMLKQGK